MSRIRASEKHPPRKDSLLLVTAVALKDDGGSILIDDQTWHGLGQWLRYFGSVTYAGLDADGADGQSSVTWLPVKEVPGSERLTIVTLPRAFKPLKFLKSYSETRDRIADAISANERLCFTIGHLIGDWGSIAALEARRQGRAYGVWYDRIEYDVIRRSWQSLSWKARIRETISIPVAKALQASIVRNSTMGLYQGGDCFEHFRSTAPKPFCVYDTHTTEDDFIPAGQLRAKVEAVRAGAPLEICYVGRAAAMKGPMDWLDALGALKRRGVNFRARWLGDGPSLDEMRSRNAALGLSDVVQLEGFVADRARVAEAMRQAHVFMFCHKTPESPRCLIEALVSGSVIAGYDSAYPRDLISQHGGGCLTPQDDVTALAGAMAGLDADRTRLGDLIERAALEGRRFDEDTVYGHRATLMRDHLPVLV